MQRVTKYFKDTANEMRHVKWPTTTQAAIYTALVVVISALVALLLAGFDYLFTNLLNAVV